MLLLLPPLPLLELCAGTFAVERFSRGKTIYEGKFTSKILRAWRTSGCAYVYVCIYRIGGCIMFRNFHGEFSFNRIINATRKECFYLVTKYSSELLQINICNSLNNKLTSTN